MQIKEMFEKQIDRDIKGVIKVGQSDEENVYQELDEYVVTKELLKHFRDFFDNYEKGIHNNTDKMGVWISGFFGSGKSHFLKILSYLLKNSVVEGKRAIEYFTDGKKIDDPMLIAKMTNSGTISSDVMLFNIDSKGSAKVGSGKAIAAPFLILQNLNASWTMKADLKSSKKNSRRLQVHHGRRRDRLLQLSRIKS